MLLIGTASLGIVVTCFLTSWLLFAAPHFPAPAQFTLPPDPPAALTVVPPDPVPPPPTRKYAITIETTADWSRAIMNDGAVFTMDAGLNPVELRSDTPQQVDHFLYSPKEVAINQKQFTNARIVVTGVVETSSPILEVRLGHGSNGTIKISSPVDSFHNDRNTDNAENFAVGALRLE